MKLDLEKDPTLDAVDRLIVQKNKSEQRNYLGMSGLGQDCERKIWYQWRWIATVLFDALTLRRFADGHYSESIFSQWLRAVPGVKLETGYQDGSQYEVKDFNGHLKGHLDGVVTGLHKAPKTMHVWEHKCVNQAKYNKLNKLKKDHGEKSALEIWDSTYFAQQILYMGYTNLKRSYMTVAASGTRELTSCRTEFDAKAFDFYRNRAKSILDSEEAPPKISRKPDYYICRWCEYKTHCHENKIAQVNCRTCAFSTPDLEEKKVQPNRPKRTGTWTCEFHKKTISQKKQREGCSDHIYIPSLIPFATVIDMNKDKPSITYATNESKKVFINSTYNSWDSDPPVFASKDLQHLDEKLMSSEGSVLHAFAKFKTAEIKLIEKSKKEVADPIPFDDPIPF